MHREHAVEELRRDEIVKRPDQLDPHDRSFNAADDQESQGEQDVQDAEPFMIDRGQPSVNPAHVEAVLEVLPAQ